jgi:hypothetical protein
MSPYPTVLKVVTANDDEQQAGDAEPDPVRLRRVENPDQVEDPGEDHEDAEQDCEHVQ